MSDSLHSSFCSKLIFNLLSTISCSFNIASLSDNIQNFAIPLFTFIVYLVYTY